jgi:hypothetical protein
LRLRPSAAARRKAEEAEMEACVRIIDSRDSTQDEKRDARRKLVAAEEERAEKRRQYNLMFPRRSKRLADP